MKVFRGLAPMETVGICHATDSSNPQQEEAGLAGCTERLGDLVSGSHNWGFHD